MGKWSETVGTGLKGMGRFLDKDQRHNLAVLPVRLLAVHDDPTNRFGARWVLTLAYLDTGEKVALGLKRNPVRDGIMNAARAKLADGETFDPIIITQDEKNDAFVIADASDEQIDAVIASTGADSLADLMAIEPWSAEDDADADAVADAPDSAAVSAGEPTVVPGEKLAKARK
jgi:hypothetical protein